MNQVFEIGYHLVVTLKLAASAILVTAVIIWVGATPWIIRRSLNRGRADDFSFALAFGVGLFTLLLGAWICFQFHFSIKFAYAIVLFACVVVPVVLRTVGRTEQPRALIECATQLGRGKPLLLMFLSFVIAYAFFLSATLTPDTLDIVVKGNNDIHLYVKMANFLLEGGSGQGNVAGINLRDIAQKDVFGAFAFLALCAFLVGADPLNVTLVAVTVLVGLTGVWITWLSVKIIRLPWILALAFALGVLYAALFMEIVLNFFLSQMISSTLLLAMVVRIFEQTTKREGWGLKSSYLSGVVFLGAIEFTYPALFLQNLAIFSLLSVWFAMLEARSSLRRSVHLVHSIAIGVLLGGMAWATVTLVSLDRMTYTINLFLTFTKADTAGWPMTLISPLMLTGLPTGWTFPSLLGWPTLHLVVIAALTIVGARLAQRQSHTTEELLIRLTPLILGAGSLLLYIIVWLWLGPSYRQWKFASYFPMLFGFAIPATFFSAIFLPEFLMAYCNRGSVIGAAVVFLVAATVGANRAQKNVGHFSRDFLAITQINKMTEVSDVVIDLPEFGQRMLAASLISSPRIHFTGLTYYGPGESSQLNAASTTRFLRERTQKLGVDQAIGKAFVLSPQ